HDLPRRERLGGPFAGAAESRHGNAARQSPTRGGGMKWLMEFYNERRGILARYGIEAPLPAAAVLLGRKAVLAEYPPTPRRSRLSLFEQAERVGGQDAGGWGTYRSVEDNGRGSGSIEPAEGLIGNEALM